jgi:hypothetical protein
MGRDARLRRSEGNPVRGLRLTQDDRDKRAADKVKALAVEIESVEQFEAIIATAKPEMQDAVRALLLPLISPTLAWAIDINRQERAARPALTITPIPED